jgi:integral membrane protein
MNTARIFNWFRKIAFTEGVSFILLLLIAMPLKYFADLPFAVTIVGGLHGFLFVAFIIMALASKKEYGKSWAWVAKAFLASIVPCGTFWMDYTQWKQEEAAIRQTPSLV